jgi:hypothetical protein
MTTHENIQAIKTYLSGFLTIPVVDGPPDFALNSQALKTFASVHDQPFDTELSNSERVPISTIPIVFTIQVERATADRQINHLKVARDNFDALWNGLAGYTPNGWQLVRRGGGRIESDDASTVRYEIRTELIVTEYPTCQ